MEDPDVFSDDVWSDDDLYEEGNALVGHHSSPIKQVVPLKEMPRSALLICPSRPIFETPHLSWNNAAHYLKQTEETEERALDFFSTIVVNVPDWMFEEGATQLGNLDLSGQHEQHDRISATAAILALLTIHNDGESVNGRNYLHDKDAYDDVNGRKELHDDADDADDASYVNGSKRKRAGTLYHNWCPHPSRNGLLAPQRVISVETLLDTSHKPVARRFRFHTWDPTYSDSFGITRILQQNTKMNKRCSVTQPTKKVNPDKKKGNPDKKKGPQWNDIEKITQAPTDWVDVARLIVRYSPLFRPEMVGVTSYMTCLKIPDTDVIGSPFSVERLLDGHRKEALCAGLVDVGGNSLNVLQQQTEPANYCVALDDTIGMEPERDCTRTWSHIAFRMRSTYNVDLQRFVLPSISETRGLVSFYDPLEDPGGYRLFTQPLPPRHDPDLLSVIHEAV
jgi:hypothetical protein